VSQPELSDKPFAIPKQAVVEAFRKVRANQGGPGVDGCTIEEYESDLRNRLYVTWNRMSSGSYFPPPVKAVAVPKCPFTGACEDARAAPVVPGAVRRV
jgi:RNA-directed DNA polymerase